MKSKFAKLRQEKVQLKEDHYTRLIEFAKQEQLLNDIQWLTTTKASAVERAEKNKKLQDERKERYDKQKKVRDEWNAR